MSERSSSPSRADSPVTAMPEQPTARPFRFTWDPSTRRPGPESVSGTTEGRADYINTNPRLPFLNTSSTSLALGAMPPEWSSSKHGFHAISTVLNNPHKRQDPPKAHSALPSVPPADLPRVRRKDFESYIRAILPEWERFEKNTQLGREGQPQLNDPTTPRAFSSDVDPIPLSPLPRNSHGRSIPPLETVPPIFFKSDFHLGDPRTFRTVTEQGNSEDWSSIDPSALGHSLPLLEKFSHYADTVEQHLVQEISQRSTSFFAALTNLNELQSESEQCLERIGKLRGMLREVDDKCAKKGLAIVQKQLHMQNLDKTRESVKFVVGVVEMTGVARGLVSAGQWGEALNVIGNLDSLYRPEATPNDRHAEASTLNGLPTRMDAISELSDEDDELGGQKLRGAIPLSSLQAFSSLPEHLRTLTLEIASSLSSELIGVLRLDFIERIANGSATSKKALDQSFGDRIRPLLQGLIRTNGLKDCILAWRDVALDEVQNVVRLHIAQYDVDDGEVQPDPGINPELTPGSGNHLREMSHTEFFHLIQGIFNNLLNGVEGLQVQSGVTMEVLESINSLTSALDPSAITSIQDELSDILSSASELANTRAAKIIAARSDQHASLDLPEFLTLFNETWGFVVKCEVICRRMIVGLRGIVVSQAKAFLQAFHQVRLSRSAKLVEDEQWNPSEVSPALQHIADVLVDSAVSDAAELRLTPGGDAAPGSTNGVTQSPPKSPPVVPKVNGTASASSKHLHIEDRTYFTVSATADVLILLLDYIKLVLNLPTLTTDAMSRVIEFLKAFNSRTCQVVLGAGAMRSAGLKNITAKHLALASQSLSIMIALVPYVREMFRRHLSSKQAVMLVEFDKLKRDYQEHQNEIHSKLVAIMGDRLSAHIKTLQAVDWNVPKPGGGINDYMEILIKETVTLHKVLSRYLPVPVVEFVMSQVFAAINHRLSEEYGKIELPHQEAKDRLLADARFLHQKLAALKNVGAPSSMLEIIITEKSIPRTGTAPSTPTSGHSMNSAGLSANQRLKGFLSGKGAPPVPTPPQSATDKALPTPNPTPPLLVSSLAPTSIPLPISPSVPQRSSSLSLNGRLEQLMSARGHSQSVSESGLPPTPPDKGPGFGFREVDTPRTEAHIRDGPTPPPMEGHSSSAFPPTPAQADSGQESDHGHTEPAVATSDIDDVISANVHSTENSNTDSELSPPIGGLEDPEVAGDGSIVAAAVVDDGDSHEAVPRSPLGPHPELPDIPS